MVRERGSRVRRGVSPRWLTIDTGRRVTRGCVSSVATAATDAFHDANSDWGYRVTHQHDVRRLRQVAAAPQALHRRRHGQRPRTTDHTPHSQIDQRGDPAITAGLHAYAASLPDVVVAHSQMSLPGTPAYHLPSRPEGAPEDAFFVGTEFAHLHAAHDGSLHLVLPPWQIGQITKLGWAELHPVAAQYGLPLNVVMLYAPHHEDDIRGVEELITASWAYANGFLPGRL